MVAFGEEYWLLVQSVTLLTIVVQAIGLVLSLIAVKGFAGAPINRVLKPLPVVLACMILANMPWAGFYLTELPYYNVIYTAVFSIGVLAAVIAAFRATMLLSERREL